MKARGLMLALAAAGAIAAAVLWPRGRDVDVAVVKTAPLTQSVVATGRIATPARIAIGSPIAATVLEITVREGDVVAPGQVLARLRADDAAALVAQAEAHPGAAMPGRSTAGRLCSPLSAVIRPAAPSHAVHLPRRRSSGPMCSSIHRIP